MPNNGTRVWTTLLYRYVNNFNKTLTFNIWLHIYMYVCLHYQFKHAMQRPAWKIEAQIRILQNQLEKLRPDQIHSWHKLNNKIKSLGIELQAAKNFEFLAK